MPTTTYTIHDAHHTYTTEYAKKAQHASKGGCRVTAVTEGSE